MDVLSSQATLAGYQMVLEASSLLGRILPMMTTAAGTIRPATFIVLGAGVAGLQAIATARRLGAVVKAFDVRAAAAEQVESLGASFITIDVEPQDASTSGGYAKQLSPEEIAVSVVAEMIHLRRNPDANWNPQSMSIFKEGIPKALEVYSATLANKKSPASPESGPASDAAPDTVSEGEGGSVEVEASAQ